MDGVRQRGFPEFVVVLERHYDRRPWDTDFAPVKHMCERIGNATVVQALDACCALWQFLDELPQKLVAVEQVRFLVGYLPEQGVLVPVDDAAVIAAWQNILSRLFRWAINIDRYVADAARATSFQSEFLDLLDEVDRVLVPRLTFWHRFARSSSS